LWLDGGLGSGVRGWRLNAEARRYGRTRRLALRSVALQRILDELLETLSISPKRQHDDESGQERRDR
jgi:hypothetical protein